jgi:hypothetical protein
LFFLLSSFWFFFLHLNLLKLTQFNSN